MTDIFLSYASADRQHAQRLAGALGQRGWSVWWDRSIPAGKRFEDVIEEALRQARCVVVLWSRTSVASSWVLDEAADGRERRILVPVLLEHVTQPLGFRGIQAADLSDWDGNTEFPRFRQLIAELAGVLGSPPGKAEVASGAEGRAAKPDVTSSEIGQARLPAVARSKTGMTLALSTVQLLLCLALLSLTSFIDLVVLFSSDPVAWFGGRANEAGSEYTIPLALAALVLGTLLGLLAGRVQDARVQLFGWVSAGSTLGLSALHWLAMLQTSRTSTTSAPEGLVNIAVITDVVYAVVVLRAWWRAALSR